MARNGVDRHEIIGALNGVLFARNGAPMNRGDLQQAFMGMYRNRFTTEAKATAAFHAALDDAGRQRSFFLGDGGYQSRTP